MTFAFACVLFLLLYVLTNKCLLTVALHVCFLSRSTFFCVLCFFSCHVMRALYEARIKIKCWNNKKGKCVWTSRSELFIHFKCITANVCLWIYYIKRCKKALIAKSLCLTVCLNVCVVCCCLLFWLEYQKCACNEENWVLFFFVRFFESFK